MDLILFGTQSPGGFILVLPEAWGIISKIHIQRIRDFSNFGDNALRILEGLFVAESGRFLTI